MADNDLKRAFDDVKYEIKSLQSRVFVLEDTIKRDKLPDTALSSDSFFKRAFTVWGHSFVAGILIGILCFIGCSAL